MKSKTLHSIVYSYFAMLVAFTILIIGVHCIPKSAINANIITSTKTLQAEGLYKKFFDFKLFQMDNFTDTYMLNIAASANEKHPVEAAMMNYAYTKNFMDLAFETEKIAKSQTDSLERSSYGRYWQGYQVILRPALVLFTYPQIRIINYILFTTLILICTWLLYKKTTLGTAVLFIVSLLLINFPIVPYSMQFSTCFYIAFISMLAIMKYPILTRSNRGLICTFFIIGGITSYLDFLTTPQLTLGLPMITYMLIHKPEKSWKTVIMLSVAWATGYGLLWASKWMIAFLLTGNNILTDAIQSAELRTSNHYKGMEMTLSNIIKFIWSNVESKHLKGPFFAGIVIIVIATGVYIKAIKSKKVFKQYSYLLLIALIVPVWFIVLRNHSIQHGWFTWRAGLLTIFSLLLFVYYTVDIKKLFKTSK